VAGFEEERAELEAVLASELLVRSPCLAQFLRYVCERHFSGQSDEIKEYNIAVEGLGRPPTFDQTRDSIVRVEAHRLRKALACYYKRDGAGHPVQIVVRPGSYVPHFLYKRPCVQEIAPMLEHVSDPDMGSANDGESPDSQEAIPNIGRRIDIDASIQVDDHVAATSIYRDFEVVD